MGTLPTGTVTFLFTDIQGSTQLARQYPKTWETMRERHHAILRSAIEAHNGYVFQIIGDAFCIAFHHAGDASRAAAKSQIDLYKEEWGETPLRVRMGIHTGKAEIQENGEYHGYLAMSRIQRLMSAGHGGQVLISAPTQELLLEDLPEGVSLRDLGERRLKDLIRPEHIYQLVIPGLPIEFPPLKTLDAYRHNLPTQLTSFIGREKEMVEIKQSMMTHRLVTLTGVGGTGKTRLALQVAADLLDQFSDGVWFVEFAAITDPNLVIQTILTVLGIPEQAGMTIQQLLMNYLHGKKMLLILDNCEHVIGAIAKLVEGLLDHSLELRIMTTGREALGIKGELIRQVPSLSLPDIKRLPTIEELPQYEAAQLFIERASLVQPDFVVTNDSAQSVAQICSRLDGIPLAIELAAARVRVMGVEQISERLNDRFRILIGGNRTSLERHQTLRAALDWSYNLLSMNEKLLLCRLSIFAGGWTLGAAEQVCAGRDDISSDEVLDVLTRLVEKSLVLLDGSRYHMLGITRQYASEKLDDSAETKTLHNNHLAYFLDFAEQGYKQVHGPDQVKWMDHLEKELDNFRTSLEWCVSGQFTESALRLLNALSYAWGWRGYSSELEGWFNKVRDFEDAMGYPALYAGLLDAIGRQRKYDDVRFALSMLEESRDIWLTLGEAGEPGLAGTLSALGEIYLYEKEKLENARSLFEQSFKIYHEHRDESGMAWSIFLMGSMAAVAGQYKEAEQLYKKSLAKFQELGDRSRIAFVFSGLGELERFIGNYELAYKFWEQNLYAMQELHSRSALSFPFLGLAWVSLGMGKFAKATNLFREGLKISNEFGDKSNVALALAGLAGVLGMTGKPEQAALLFGTAKLMAENTGYLEPADQKDFDHYLKIAREQLDESSFEKAWAEGRAMTMEQAIEYALDETHE